MKLFDTIMQCFSEFPTGVYLFKVDNGHAKSLWEAFTTFMKIYNPGAYSAETYSEPCQTSKMERSSKIVNG